MREGKSDVDPTAIVDAETKPIATRSRPLDVVHFLRKPVAGVYSIERVYSAVRDELPDDIQARVVEASEYSTGILPRLRAALAAAKHAGEVNHVTGDVHFLTFFLRKRSTILTIHDCLPLRREKGLRRFLIWLFWYWLPIKRCAAIVAVSPETKRLILKYVGCDPRKIVVIDNPIPREFEPVPFQFNRQQPKILQVGTRPRKNLERVIAAVEGLECTLSILGSLDDRLTQYLEQYGIAYENFQEMHDAEVRALYADADILVFASLEEGFGLPILEAQATGRPVVTSDKSPMRQVAGGAAVLVDPHDSADIRRGIDQVIQDEVLRSELIQKGLQNVERFSTRTAAEAYAELYRRIASIPKGARPSVRISTTPEGGHAANRNAKDRSRRAGTGTSTFNDHSRTRDLA